MIKENPTAFEKFIPLITAIAMFMQSLDGTILNTSLPTIAKSMHYEASEIHSILVSYTLTLAIFIPISGWFSDKFGSKRIFILSVIIFTLGSIFCALSFDLLTMNISRIIQAVGASMMVPVARLAILYQFPRNQLLKIMNIITIPGLLGLVIGPSLGGWLSDNLSWHWIFLVNIPIGILGIVAAYFIMPNFKNHVGKFDFLGLVYLSGGLVTLTYMMEVLANKFINYQLVVLLILLSVILFVKYIRHSKKINIPLINLKLFKINTLKIGLLGSLLTRFGISGLPFLLPLLFQIGFGYSATVSGLLLLPSSLTTLAVKPIIVRLVKYFGYRNILFFNTLFLAVIIIVFSFVEKSTSLYITILLMVLYGGFTSIQMTSMNTITLANVSDDEASGANSLLTIMQQLSISFGVSIAALILNIYQKILPFNADMVIQSFHYTLFTLGILTAISSFTFTFLKKTDGQQLANA